VAATNSDNVVNSTRAAFIRLDDDSGHPRTQIPVDDIVAVPVAATFIGRRRPKSRKLIA
jgi:hypothetical protein